jgi:hypothetical protein
MVIVSFTVSLITTDKTLLYFPGFQKILLFTEAFPKLQFLGKQP